MPPRRSTQKEFEGPNEEQWWRSDGESSGSDEAGGAERDEEAKALHDPDMDEKDAKWAEKQRQGRVSDAILSW